MKRVCNLSTETINKYAEKFNSFDDNKYYLNWKKFRNCSACIADNGDNIVLLSYRTIVALFDKESKTVFARGRYSATTYQHVSKFAHDCGAKKVENLELVNWY